MIQGTRLRPVYGWQETNAWLTGQYKSHLWIACIIRAIPETEIPLAMRGDIYLIFNPVFSITM